MEQVPLGTGGGIALRSPRARRELLRAERRLAARGGPRRARRVPSLDGRESDDPAHTGRRPQPLRARPDRGRRPRRDLPREAAPRGDRHRPDQRRPVRARARGSRARSRPTARSRSSARSFPGSRQTGRCSESRFRVTGSTSERPSRTCRRTETSSNALFPTEIGERPRRRLHACRPERRGPSRSARSSLPCTSGRAQWSRRARASGASPCSARARDSRRVASSRTPSSAHGRRSVPAVRRRIDRRRRRGSRRRVPAAQPGSRRPWRVARSRERRSTTGSGSAPARASQRRLSASRERRST